MKIYNLKFEKSYIKSLKKLDKFTRKRITQWVNANLLDTTNPYFSGKSLSGNLKGYWRYRIGDYRLIAEIKDDELIIIAIDVGHRREIHKTHK